jgi:hypothetical protein
VKKRSNTAYRGVHNVKTLKISLVTVYTKCWRNLITLHHYLLQTICNGRPIPLSCWLLFRSILGPIFHCQDRLSPSFTSLRNTGASLQVPELQKLLWNDVLGEWSLDRATIELLWRKMQQDRPKIILECGAGVSTLVLATYAASQHSKSAAHIMVLSLE